MSDRKRGRTAQPRPIFVTRYNAFRARFTGGPAFTGGRLTLGFPRCTFCLTIYQPEATHSGALQPITKQHGWLLGLPAGYLPMACSKCKTSKTWEESKTRYHARKKLRLGVSENAFTNVCGLCEESIVDEVEVDKQFSVGDSVFYKAESKVSPATITAVTDHVDRKAYNIELSRGMELVANSEDILSFDPTTHSPPDWWRPANERAVSCDRVHWGHHACFLAANSVYRGKLNFFGNPPLAESQPHVGAGNYTVDKLMGELAMIKVELRKTTRELARVKLQGKDAPLDPVSRYPKRGLVALSFSANKRLLTSFA